MKKILCFMLAALILLPFALPSVDSATVVSGDIITAQIRNTYKKALSLAGKSSFNGYCGQYVNYQLVALGINKSYINGNGNELFDKYKNMTKTTGGFEVKAYPAASYTLETALRAISASGKPVTNILIGIQQTTGSSAGRKYGHAFFIHAIIDGYVYFSDSFSVTVNGKSYSEGMPIVATIEQVCKTYRASSYYFDGAIHFIDPNGVEGEETDSAETTGPVDTETTAPETTVPETATPETTAPETTAPETEPPVDPADKVCMPGIYHISKDEDLYIRSTPSAGSSTTILGKLTIEADVWVTDTVFQQERNGIKWWGYTNAEGHWGWICLYSYDSTTTSPNKNFEIPLMSDISPLVLDIYRASTFIEQRGFESYDEAIAVLKSYSGCTANMRVIDGSVMSGEKVLPANITLYVGHQTSIPSDARLDLNSKAVSYSPIECFDKDPFVSLTRDGDKYIYNHDFALSLMSARLELGDYAVIRFTGDASGYKNGNVTYKLEGEWSNGEAAVYEVSSYDSTDNAPIFRTDGISAKKYADEFTGRIAASITSDGVTYTEYSDEMTYSVATYIKRTYKDGVDTPENNLLVAMANFGAEVQKYFSYNTGSLANSVLPESARTVAFTDDMLVGAKPAPEMYSESTGYVGSAQLVMSDVVSIKLNLMKPEADKSYKLLVFTEAEYAALKAANVGASDDALLSAANCKNVLEVQNGSFTLEGVAAKDFADTYYFRLCETQADGEILYDRVISYSVLTYCENMISDGVTENIDALCGAIVAYAAAAREYFG